MKICLCCGAECAPDAPHCLACGECSFGPATAAPIPARETPPAVLESPAEERPPVDSEAPTDPAPPGDATAPEAPAQPAKRGPGRPRKDAPN